MQGKTGLLFGIGRKMFWVLFRRYCALARIPAHKAHCHTLLPTKSGRAGIENVRQYLGHKSIASTGAYLKVRRCRSRPGNGVLKSKQ
jgi:integrase